MASANKLIVLGLKDVMAKLEELPTRMGVNVARRGLVKAAGVIRDEARAQVPKRTGKLAKSIVAESRRTQNQHEYRASVTIRKAKKGSKGQNPRRYAHLVEFGVAPHFIGKGSRRAVRTKNRVTVINRGHGTMHPGHPADPFLRPAFDTKKEEAVRAFHNTILSETAKEVAKLSRQKKGK